ncbi:MAG TPA: Ca2+-dependent phosphoinositide-specific phospholipase C [Rectinemataceae bacterium]|nr:Ca2+-dependent phosphoinositide-specific phospholipase C [Rectinemataceae bacterium]
MSNQQEAHRRAPLAIAAIAFGVLIAVAIVAFGIAVAALLLDRASEERNQVTRMEGLREHDPGPSPSLSIDRAIPDSTPFAKLRLLATHNSYRRGSNSLGLFFIGLVKPGEPRNLAYAHKPLTAQLELGLRSFELDLRPRGDRFILEHVPLVDPRTWEPDFALALEELALWSDRNPGHLPIVLLFELKNDYSFLDPTLGPWDAAAFDRLDAAIRTGLGTRLYSPDDRSGRPWPTVGEMRGRFLVILHENEDYRAIYEAGHPNLAGRAMFDCLPGGAPGAFFAILNDPFADASPIAAAEARGTVVRTMAGAGGDLRPGMLEAALASGAQIISTDYPVGYTPGPEGFVASLPGGKTVDVLP